MRKKVLLFSTGLDSVCLYYLVKADVNLFIKTGTEDNNLELERLNKFEDITILDMSFLKDFELPNKILPYRNYFFAMVAAQYGQEIYLGSIKGDIARDSNLLFAGLLEKALSYYAHGPADQVPYPGDIKIHLPLKFQTKSDIVHEYIDAGYDPDMLINHSSSCYFPEHNKECGKCKSCLRKLIALTLNGLTPAFDLPDYNILLNFRRELLIRGETREAEEVKMVMELYK